MTRKELLRLSAGRSAEAGVKSKPIVAHGRLLSCAQWLKRLGGDKPVRSEDTLRERLRTNPNKVASGIHISLPVPGVVELAALCGYDYVIVDLQHTTITESQLEDMARAGMAHGINVLTRISDRSFEGIGRILDTGVEGFIVPMISSADDVRRVVHAALRPPHGGRSWSYASRAGGFASNQSTNGDLPFIGVLIETKEAVDDIDEIVKVPHLDMVFPVTSDLRASLREPGMSDPEAEALVDKAWEKMTALFPRDDGPMLCIPHNRKHWSMEVCRQRGVRMVTHGIDLGLLQTGLERTLQEFVRNPLR